MLRENRGMFYFVERRNRFRRKFAKKVGSTQMTSDAALDAIQAGRTHKRLLISRRLRQKFLLVETRLRRLASNDWEASKF
jgi:hypothetical protein